MDTRKSQSTKPNPQSPDYKEHIFRSAFANCPIHEGDLVKVKGTPQRGKVMKVEHDFKKVKWNQNKPEFIIVEIDEQLYTTHPSRLKRVHKL